MKKFYIAVVVGVLLVLGACSADKESPTPSGSVDDGETITNNGAIDHGVDDKQVGFNMSGGKIEEAADVPAAEKKRILEAFDVYINKFNKKDIDGYIDLLSSYWDKAEERELITDIFSENDVNREVSDVTIVKYSENEAQVFAKIVTTMKQLSSGFEMSPEGRQVTVFTKEDGEWKVGPIHFIGEEK